MCMYIYRSICMYLYIHIYVYAKRREEHLGSVPDGWSQGEERERERERVSWPITSTSFEKKGTKQWKRNWLTSEETDAEQCCLFLSHSSRALSFLLLLDLIDRFLLRQRRVLTSRPHIRCSRPARFCFSRRLQFYFSHAGKSCR